MDTEQIQESALLAIEGLDNDWPVTFIESMVEITSRSARGLISGLDADEMRQALEIGLLRSDCDSECTFEEIRENLSRLEKTCREASLVDEVTAHLMLDGLIAEIKQQWAFLVKNDAKLRNLAAMVLKRETLDVILDIADESGF